MAFSLFSVFDVLWASQPLKALDGQSHDSTLRAGDVRNEPMLCFWRICPTFLCRVRHTVDSRDMGLWVSHRFWFEFLNSLVRSSVSYIHPPLDHHQPTPHPSSLLNPSRQCLSPGIVFKCVVAFIWLCCAWLFGRWPSGTESEGNIINRLSELNVIIYKQPVALTFI